MNKWCYIKSKDVYNPISAYILLHTLVFLNFYEMKHILSSQSESLSKLIL